MSWWIKEHIAVNEDETKQLCSIEADNQTSLPAADQTATAGFIIVRGSSALVLDTGDRYIMNSSGTWIMQPSGVQLDLSGYATTQDLTDGLAAKVDTTTYTAGQAAQESEIGVVAAMGAKNLFPITAVSQTIGGVTFTVNSDGTVTANGTKTNNDWLYLSTGNSLAAGTYILSSGLAPQSDSRIRLIITTGNSLGSAIMGTEGERQVHKKQLTSDYTGLYYAIRIESGTTVNNLTFKPMIRHAEITDSTYVPYAPTNRELYEMILALQSGNG